MRDQTGMHSSKGTRSVVRSENREALLTFYDFPAAHWVHLRTANPIESTFATVRLRTKVTKGAGTRQRGFGDDLQASRRGPNQMAEGQ